MSTTTAGNQGFRIVHRTIPTEEGTWNRSGHLVRIKLIDLESALPPGLDLQRIRSLRVKVSGPAGESVLASHLDYGDGYGRWQGTGGITADTQLYFYTPTGEMAGHAARSGRWKRAGSIPVTLWDSRNRARREGVAIEYSLDSAAASAPLRGALRLRKTVTGYAVECGRRKLLHFNGNKEFQIDQVAPAGKNLVPRNRLWRWLPAETVAELAEVGGGRVEFIPEVTRGLVLVIRVQAEVKAGTVSTTLRIFQHAGALVMECADYRAVRARPEWPPDRHPRCYAGQIASPYPGVHYAAFMLGMPAGEAKVCDALAPFQTLDADQPLALVYEGDRQQKGWNWLALQGPQWTAAIAAHGRSHFPDHPWKAGTEDGQTLIALEPFGSEVEGQYRSCDRYWMIVADSVERVREVFDTLDTWPILVKVPVRRDLAFLKTYECLCRWVNLNLDYLMKDGRYRNALKTDGTFRDDADTCVTAIGEMIRLYEKTGAEEFRRVAEAAADFVAGWIEAGRFHTRGEKVGANGGGIYQNEQIGLLLALARVYRHSHAPRLQRAIERGVQWLYDHRGGKDTWGWTDYLWHAGGWAADGKPLYFWPVNTNEFATLNFRLYQLLGDKTYYEKAMAIVTDYLQHIRPDSWEIVKGGGVSDTTRGVHLLAEVLEVCRNDPRIDADFFRQCIQKTLERFWIEGWMFVRHSMYGEVLLAGDTPGTLFSPGFHHWHNCGSHLDIIPRIGVAAEAGVSPDLSRWALRDLAYDFDVRFGIEEHTHLTRIGMRDTDCEPACWLDPELLPALYAMRRRGWVEEDDFQILHYKIHQMVQRTFLALDEDHGGWANYYDAHDGAPLKYLAYWEHRHSFERLAPGECLELWGVPTRDAFYDHLSHYWTATEALVDELLAAETVTVRAGRQVVRCRADGLATDLPGLHPALVAQAPQAQTVELDADPLWRLREARTVRIAGKGFWLLAVERS